MAIQFRYNRVAGQNTSAVGRKALSAYLTEIAPPRKGATTSVLLKAKTKSINETETSVFIDLYYKYLVFICLLKHYGIVLECILLQLTCFFTTWHLQRDP